VYSLYAYAKVLFVNDKQILTFDTKGISDHPNHKSLPTGMKRLISTIPPAKAPKLFMLMSVPLHSKYQSILAPFFSKVDIYLIYLFNLVDRTIAKVLVTLGIAVYEEDGIVGNEERNAAEWTMPVFISGFAGYQKAFTAAQQHQSQLVWFRWLYVSFSRYMWVNEWTEVLA
jgi:N-acetylglucosaminylphosphatidylinositol deacetylase